MRKWKCFILVCFLNLSVFIFLNLPQPQFGRVTSSINQFSFQNNRISSQNLPSARKSVVNDSTCIAFGQNPNVTIKQLCFDPSFEFLHSLSSHDPILNPLAQISSPWCEALPNEKLLVKTVLLLLLLGLLVCLWAPVKAAIRVHEYADGRPKQYSTCTIFLLCRSCRIACTRNRLSKQILKYSRKWSTSIFLTSLTTKGRYRKATLAKAIL